MRQMNFQMLAKQYSGGVVIDEVEEYLGTAPVPDASLLEFWKRATKFPVLQRIARDYLGIPATSVQSERENSKAKYVITDSRNRLSNNCVQATLCLKSCINFTDEQITTLD